jgi:hypothetical protein
MSGRDGHVGSPPHAVRYYGLMPYMYIVFTGGIQSFLGKPSVLKVIRQINNQFCLFALLNPANFLESRYSISSAATCHLQYIKSLPQISITRFVLQVAWADSTARHVWTHNGADVDCKHHPR